MTFEVEASPVVPGFVRVILRKFIRLAASMFGVFMIPVKRTE